jgi:cysteinyl-tRNA synthetase
MLIVFSACKKKKIPDVDFAQEMRKLVIEIAVEAKTVNPNFIIIPQNGAPLITNNHETDGELVLEYLAAIDGQGQEDLFYGYQKDDKKTPQESTDYLLYFLNLLESNGVEVLTTDYCRSIDNINDSYAKNGANGFISFAATERNLTNIPDDLVNVNNENDLDILNLSDAKNFLYLINTSVKFSEKSDFLAAVSGTNYDIIIMDRDFNDEQFSADEISTLKTKQNGGKRLVICYMSIGEAEDYRSYWDSSWEKEKNSPEWLYAENKKWRGNYKVFYWMQSWKNIIYGTENSYLTSIIKKDFDGVYLDIIDAYEYYEEKK